MNDTVVAVPPFWYEHEQMNLYMHRYDSFFETISITDLFNGSDVDYIIWVGDVRFYFNDPSYQRWYNELPLCDGLCWMDTSGVGGYG